MGGSYSAATGSSSKIVDSLNLKGGTIKAGQPKLAQVATMLLAAKAAGQLPSALKSVSRENARYSERMQPPATDGNGSNAGTPPATGEGGAAPPQQQPGGATPTSPGGGPTTPAAAASESSPFRPPRTNSTTRQR